MDRSAQPGNPQPMSQSLKQSEIRPASADQSFQARSDRSMRAKAPAGPQLPAA
jgi:hypothetical protein